MLHEHLLRDHAETVRRELRRRCAGAEAEQALTRWLALDAERRAAATYADELVLRHADRHTLAAARRTVAELEAQQQEAMFQLPNLPDARVPNGATAAENVELRRAGDLPTFDFLPRPHDELAAGLGLLDLPRATRLAGPRFPLLLGAGARLARALAACMLDLHAQAGYLEVAPPHLLREATLRGSGHLPRHADELYAISASKLYLSPTAEAQLVALHAGETLAATSLPLAYTACTPAFRREAGSTRASMRGLLRQHQFDKVELVRICAPEHADAEFERLVADAERVLRTLALPYRVVALCAGELPFSSQRTVDLEVWMPGQKRYVEISSISDCGTFQARRLNLRYRAGASRARYPHTLNGSALAIGRTLAALIENGQRADGSVALPPALAPYFGAELLIGR